MNIIDDYGFHSAKKSLLNEKCHAFLVLLNRLRSITSFMGTKYTILLDIFKFIKVCLGLIS